MFQIPTQNIDLALEKTPASFTYSGLTHYMTAAAATLKMTTRTAVNMVVICYIKIEIMSRTK